jgi:hypothetical protein
METSGRLFVDGEAGCEMTGRRTRYPQQTPYKLHHDTAQGNSWTSTVTASWTSNIVSYDIGLSHQKAVSWARSVNAGYELDDRKSTLGRSKDASLRPHVQAGCSTLLSNKFRGLLPWRWGGRSVKFPLPLVPMSRMRGTLPSRIYTSSWCGAKAH